MSQFVTIFHGHRWKLPHSNVQRAAPSVWAQVCGTVIAPECFALASAEGSWWWERFAVCSSHINLPPSSHQAPRRSSAGDLAELVGGGRGPWLSCPPAQQLCLVNPYLPRCPQEKQGIRLQAICSFKLELVTHSKYICTEKFHPHQQMVSFVCVQTAGTNQDFSASVTEFWPCGVIRENILTKVRVSLHVAESSLGRYNYFQMQR